MNIEIQERIEGRRGCGYRKSGGIYLMGPPEGGPCCKLPFPLTVCPTCGTGIKPSRGWTWVDAGKLIKDTLACTEQLLADSPYPQNCPLSTPEAMGRAGLLWIGEQFYKTPQDFLQEARDMGICRRISTVPREFELGKTWVLLAHRKVVCGPGYDGAGSDPEPAIFSVFKPSAIEYVVHGDETGEELERLAGRGLTPVRVKNRMSYE